MRSGDKVSSKPVRLGRTPLNFVCGGLGTGFNAVGLSLGLFLIVGAVVSGLHGKSWGPIGIGVLCLVTPAHGLWVRILLTDVGIEIRRVRPIVIDRASIYRVGPGPVSWGKGDPVEGIEIQTTDGQRIPMPYSEFLGAERRRLWVAEIEAWLGIDSTALPLIAPARNLKRPVSFSKADYPYHDPSWID